MYAAQLESSGDITDYTFLPLLHSWSSTIPDNESAKIALWQNPTQLSFTNCSTFEKNMIASGAQDLEPVRFIRQG